MPNGQVRSITRYCSAQNSISDTEQLLLGQPSKITPERKHQVERTVQDNPRASLNEITKSIQNLDIGRTTVNKVT